MVRRTTTSPRVLAATERFSSSVEVNFQQIKVRFTRGKPCIEVTTQNPVSSKPPSLVK